MNPSNNETTGMQLPPPMVEQAPAQSAGAEQAGAAHVEQAPAGAESAPAPGAAMPVMAPTGVPPVLPVVPGMPAAPQPTAGSGASAGLTASDDADLIEKEWVDKAKAIVERTRNDPYKQSEELTMVKADYLKKRYNKTIKLNK